MITNQQDFTQKSFWLSSVPYNPSPSLQGDITVDVAIIGGGFTGISTAYNLKKMEPSLKVAVLESEVVGFGASGRNGGFNMTLFGFTFSITSFRFGRERAKDAHHYMEKAVDYVKFLVEDHKIDCDYEHPGFLRVATSPKYVKRIQHEINIVQSLGIKGIEWIGKEKLSDQVRSPIYLGAWWEPRCGILNPAKLCWGMKRVAMSLGVEFYEQTPCLSIQRGSKILIQSPKGSVTADKIVFATNAYSHLIPQLKRKQIPVFTYIVLTEPLTQDRLSQIGWKNRQGIEDARNLVHYYRLTKDNRLLMGGRNVGVAFGNNMSQDYDERVFDKLEKDVVEIFPSLKGIRFTHRWGGPVSVPLDLAPAMGYLGDERMVYCLGCVGHGVSLSHLNGKTSAELILGKKSELTEIFFVNRKTIPCPPEPIRFVVSEAILAYMRLEDSLIDRHK